MTFRATSSPVNSSYRYADDVQFIHTCHPDAVLHLKNRIEETLVVADLWFAQNSLKINPTKTDFTIVHTRQRRSVGTFSIQFAGSADIQASQSVKTLGLVVDQNLRESHVSAVVRRCYASICGISKFSRQLTESVKKRLIESLVFPHLYYCLTVWGQCCQKYRGETLKFWPQKPLDPSRFFRIPSKKPEATISYEKA